MREGTQKSEYHRRQQEMKIHAAVARATYTRHPGRGKDEAVSAITPAHCAPRYAYARMAHERVTIRPGAGNGNVPG